MAATYTPVYPLSTPPDCSAHRPCMHMGMSVCTPLHYLSKCLARTAGMRWLPCQSKSLVGKACRRKIPVWMHRCLACRGSILRCRPLLGEGEGTKEKHSVNSTWAASVKAAAPPPKMGIGIESRHCHSCTCDANVPYKHRLGDLGPH